METFSSIQNIRQETEFNSSLLTGAPIANRHQRGQFDLLTMSYERKSNRKNRFCNIIANSKS